MYSIINIIFTILKILLIGVSLYAYKNIYDFFKSLYDNRHEGISKDEIIMSILLVIVVISIASVVSMIIIK